MKNKKTFADYFGKLKGVLIILSILAAVKMLFWGGGLDEEYQLVMAYRNINGDKLFLNMWEPHQTSAFLCSLLMRPYLALIGNTGIMVWLRFCGTMLHLGISIYLYRVLCRMISKDSAFLAGLIYFNTIPKQIMLPEFGIMQVWFLTLLSLFLIKYYDSDVRKKKYLIFAAFAMVFEVLSYPSCLLLYVPVVWIIWRRSGKERFKDIGILTGVCALCGIVYLGILLRNNTAAGLVHTLSYIVNGDITHSFSFEDKLLFSVRYTLGPILIWLAVLALAKAGAAFTVKRRRRGGDGQVEESFQCRVIWATALSCLLGLFYWVVLNIGYEYMQIHLAVFMTFGVFCAVREKRRKKADAENAMTDRRLLQAGLLLDGIVLTACGLLAVVFLTDLPLMNSLSHGVSGAVFGAALVTLYWEDEKTDREDAPGKRKYRTAGLFVVLFLWAFTAVFGKGYTLRSRWGYANVLQSGGIMKQGPAAGTISDYMCAYIYNCDCEDWQNMVRDGDRVLIMVDQIRNLGTIRYLFKDVEISHFSVVDPTPYDERLLEYWKMFPEKKPNVIVVDCWYGQLLADPEGWIMQYVEKEFGYTSVEEGRYIRIYRKDG